MTRILINCSEIENGGDIDRSLAGIAKVAKMFGGNITSSDQGEDDDGESYLKVTVQVETDEATLETAIEDNTEVCIAWTHTLKAKK